MVEDQLSLQISEHARIAYSSLGADDRRRVDAWFDHLRNWRNDQFIRSKSSRLDSEDETYVLRTSMDLVIAFTVARDTVTILSIFRDETLNKFAATAAIAARGAT
jgi:hypothetical protein